MALARGWSVALRGVDGHVVEIEADVGGGLPGVHLLGLPDAALQESRDRVRAAVVNSGVVWPNQRIVLALSPATLRKTGSGFDLALACCVLAAAEHVPQHALDGTVLLGELALDGRLRPVRGILPALLAARTAGMRRVVVPESALAEAALVPDIEVLGAADLREVLDWLRGGAPLRTPGPVVDADGPEPPDLADVVGQDDARHALEVAAAGAPPAAGRPAGHRQDDAGAAPGGAAATARGRRRTGAGGGAVGGGPAARRRPAGHAPAGGGAAPLQLDGRARRRR